jgi:hypothetical protein
MCKAKQMLLVEHNSQEINFGWATVLSMSVDNHHNEDFEKHKAVSTQQLIL